MWFKYVVLALVLCTSCIHALQHVKFAENLGDFISDSYMDRYRSSVKGHLHEGWINMTKYEMSKYKNGVNPSGATLQRMGIADLDPVHKGYPLNSDELCMDAQIGCFQKTGSFVKLPERPINWAPKQVATKFRLWTKQNNATGGQLLSWNDTMKIKQANLNVYSSIRFLVHGYLEHSAVKSTWQNETKDLLLKADPKASVIQVDWSDGNFFPYAQAVGNSQYVGRQIGYMATRIMAAYPSAQLTRIHCVGHSLGSHVCGYAGKWVKKLTSQRLGRITALDPAAPSFERTAPEVRLDRKDAWFVDVVHTDTNADNKLTKLNHNGILEALGHLDFYPNNGQHQPVCKNKIAITLMDMYTMYFCDHQYSVKLYMASLALELAVSKSADQLPLHCRALVGYPCENWQKFTNGSCDQCLAKNAKCPVLGIRANEYTPINEYNDDRSTTVYLKTSAEIPYYCENYYNSKLTLAPTPAQDVSSVKVELGVAGVEGRETVEFSKEYMDFKHGDTLSSQFQFTHTLAPLQCSAVRWYRSPNPFHYFGASKLYVSQVKFHLMNVEANNVEYMFTNPEATKKGVDKYDSVVFGRNGPICDYN